MNDDYIFLSRLKDDIECYLLNKNIDALYTKDKVKQIELMREIFDGLTTKPVWLTKEDIDNYEKRLKEDDYQEMS